MELSARLVNCGVGVTTLPATDLYLKGRDVECNVPRGVAPVHVMVEAGVNCSVATNNVLNPFTPFGDCSLLRMANLYANVAQLGSRTAMDTCFDMVTARPARLMRLREYEIALGNPADIVVLDCTSRRQAVAEIAPVVSVFKRGRKTVTGYSAQLHG
jgi:cytosine deaminase